MPWPCHGDAMALPWQWVNPQNPWRVTSPSPKKSMASRFPVRGQVYENISIRAPSMPPTPEEMLISKELLWVNGLWITSMHTPRDSDKKSSGVGQILKILNEKLRNLGSRVLSSCISHFSCLYRESQSVQYEIRLPIFEIEILGFLIKKSP